MKHTHRSSILKLAGFTGLIVAIAWGIQGKYSENPEGSALSAKDVKADLEALEEELSERFAYWRVGDIDFEELKKGVPEKPTMEREELALHIQEIFGRFVDGHARVEHGETIPSRVGNFLPFLIEPSGEQFVAIRPNRSAFANDDYPFIRSIDRRKIEDWIELANRWVPDGSPQYQRRHGLRFLRYLGFLREQIGTAPQGALTVEFSDASGNIIEKKMMPADRKPFYGTWPRKKNGFHHLGNEVGYLRLAEMEERDVERIDDAMNAFQEGVGGLIVDVRGNGGGSRALLLALARRVISPDEAPVVVNACRYRLHPRHSDDILDARFAYLKDSQKFGSAERDSIDTFAKTFKPSWEPPQEEFSDWHYLVLGPGSNKEESFGGPIVVLTDEKCFSATDIFVAGMGELPNVTLVGQPTGGGSARIQGFSLPRSDLRIKIASMISYQPNGLLFDGHGVAPDILVERPPSYYLVDGEDVILKRGLEILREKGVMNPRP